MTKSFCLYPVLRFSKADRFYLQPPRMRLLYCIKLCYCTVSWLGCGLIYVLLYEEWARFGFLVGYSMYTMYVEVYEHTGAVSVLCAVPFTWKQLIGKFYNCGISTVRRQIKKPITPCKRNFNFLLRDVFARQVPSFFHIIRTVRDFSNIYDKLKTKIKKKGIPPRRKREIKIWTDLEEE